MIFTDVIAYFMTCTAKCISTVMVVVDEVSFGAGEFEVCAVLAEGCIFSSSMRSKASIIVGELCFDMFFREESFANGVEYMNQT